MRAIALIDGEHHPGVVRDALDRLAGEYQLVGVLFVGGQEKLGLHVLEDPPDHYGRDVAVPRDGLLAELRSLAAASGPELVIDISGEPILDGAGRMQIASVALDLGLEYRSADTRLTPPPQQSLDAEVPVVSVIGTGKRTGKTALGVHFANLLRERGERPVVVSMGRGGPSEPQVVAAEALPSVGELLAIARDGRHAASDYLEDAVLGGVATVGCRRCGEGLAGEVFESNVVEGARLALTLNPSVVLIEGSGAAFPPVAADRTVCVTSARLARTQALEFLGPLRLMRADLVAVLGADALQPSELERLRRDLAPWCGDALLACALRAEPFEPIAADARVAVFTTAPSEVEPQLRASLAGQAIEPVSLSFNLARREALEHDLRRALAEGCDVFLTELKAAAIDTVAERAETAGTRVVFLRNRPVSLPGEPDLDGALLQLIGSTNPATGTSR